MGVDKSEKVDAPVSGESPVEAGVPPAISGVIDTTKLQLTVESLAGQKALVERVCATSEIKEEKIFTKREVLEKMLEFVAREKLAVADAQVILEEKNAEGALVVLHLKLLDANGSYRVLSYIIKGRHGENTASTSYIDQVPYDKEGGMDGYPSSVAEYNAGQWVLEP